MRSRLKWSGGGAGVEGTAPSTARSVPDSAADPGRTSVRSRTSRERHYAEQRA
ncbi:hypothetical protein [Streptomyces erythrochromogenes]|uniref:hypothetical protein n=1 Tax=Streptomyces erythrochromogenes TaxID=285574 RepID=UPI00387071BC|nr:hypothetical protein OG489_37755 [Streptomyces erythrochromogenes]